MAKSSHSNEGRCANNHSFTFGVITMEVDISLRSTFINISNSNNNKQIQNQNQVKNDNVQVKIGIDAYLARDKTGSK